MHQTLLLHQTLWLSAVKRVEICKTYVASPKWMLRSSEVQKLYFPTQFPSSISTPKKKNYPCWWHQISQNSQIWYHLSSVTSMSSGIHKKHHRESRVKCDACKKHPLTVIWSFGEYIKTGLDQKIVVALQARKKFKPAINHNKVTRAVLKRACSEQQSMGVTSYKLLKTLPPPKTFCAHRSETLY